MGEESDDFEEATRVGAEAVECRGSKGEFDRFNKALVVICLKHLGPLDFPLLCQSIAIPRVMSCSSCE